MTPASTKNIPPNVIFFEMVKNVILTNREPWARSLIGKISDEYAHVMGPSPIEKKETWAHAAMILNTVAQTGFLVDFSNNLDPMPNLDNDTAMPTTKGLILFNEINEAD